MGNLQSSHGEGLSKAELERMERRCAAAAALPPLRRSWGAPSLCCLPTACVLPALLYHDACYPPTTTSTCLAGRRLKRLGRGEKELARSDFQMIPELAGNPFLPRIFEMWVLSAQPGAALRVQQCRAAAVVRVAPLHLLLAITVHLQPPEHAMPPAGLMQTGMATCMRGTCGRCWRAWGGWRATRRSASSVSWL